MLYDPWERINFAPQHRLILHYWLRWQALRVLLCVTVMVLVGVVRYVTWPLGEETILATVKWGVIAGMVVVAGIAARQAWQWWRKR